MKRKVKIICILCCCCLSLVSIASAETLYITKSGSSTVTSNAVGLETSVRYHAAANSNSSGTMTVRGQVSAPGNPYTTLVSYTLTAGQSGDRTSSYDEPAAFRIQLAGKGTGNGYVRSPK